MAIFILSVSSLQFLFAWTATAFSYQHLSAFDRGADLALQISFAAGNASSAAIMAAIQNDITVLDNRRNLFANFVFVCDTLLFAIAFGVFLCTVIICRRAIASVMSSLRLRRKNIINHAVANTLEEHSGRMLGISVLNMVALFVLMISYIIMGGGLVSIKSAAQCQGSYEAGPCSR